MDTLTFVVEILKALAWPTATLAIAILFRRELRTLLHRVKKGKIGPAEFEFEATIAALRDRVGAERGSPAEPDKSLVALAEVDPRAAIPRSCLEVHSLVESIFSTHA